jgi:hypothetical protein
MENGYELAEKDPSSFRTRQVKIFDDSEKISLFATGDELSFQEMSSLRRAINPAIVNENLSKHGHTFANVGIGALLTLHHQGQKYLVRLKQNVKEYGPNHFTMNSIGGYLESDHITNPEEGEFVEIAEELLPTHNEDTHIIRTNYQGNPIGLPFEGKFSNSQSSFLLEQGTFTTPNLRRKPVSYLNTRLKHQPGIVFEPGRNTAKLMYSFDLHPSTNLSDLEVTLNGSEDEFDPIKGKVISKFHKAGIYLIKINDEKLTDKVYKMVNGKLVRQDPTHMLLSEEFAVDKNGFCNEGEIKTTLLDYLETQ